MSLTKESLWRAGKFALLLAMIMSGSPTGIGAGQRVTARTPSVASLVLVSGPSPFTPGCEGAPQSGTNYLNAVVEPWVAINPTDQDNVIGVWQQDRWSNGGAHALVTGVSYDGGLSWDETFAPFSRCAGGDPSNGGDYERASDPWVTLTPNGDAYQISLSFNNSDPTSAVLVSKSIDGGMSWSDPITLIRDTAATVFNDKESITADRCDANFVYVVWDRLAFSVARAPGTAPELAVGFRGPTWFSRTTDGGSTWEPAHIIFDPGDQNQTIGNQVVVLPNCDLVNVFNLIINPGSSFNVALIRSADHGSTWSAPIIVDKLMTVGVKDPNTGQPIRTGNVIPEIAVDPNSGKLYAVWQDGRFSGFAHDDIALSVSTDGGSTWTAPVRVNKTPDNAAAFTPSVYTAADGTIAVTYYDFRNATPDPTTLPTDYWIVQCSSGCANPENWTESHIAGPFDMKTAPVAGGFFVGDYQGLTARGSGFLPFFVMTNSGDLDRRTDVFAAPADATVRGILPTLRHQASRQEGCARSYSAVRSATCASGQPASKRTQLLP